VSGRGGRRRIRLGLAGALLLALCGTGARAEERLEPGQSFTGFVALDGQQIPLPEGEWLLAGEGYEMAPSISDVAYGAIETVVLFRAQSGMVTALVVAQHNLIPIEDGWGTASECTRDDLPVALNFDDADDHGSCGFAAAVDTGSAKGSPSAWKAALLFARQRELVVSHRWLMAGLRLSDRHDVVDARYYFSAAIPRHWPPRPAGGGPAAAKRSPAMAALGRWLPDMQALVGLGFNNGLAGVAPLPMPWSPGLGATRTADLRLAQLDALHAAKVVPDDFYARRHGDVIKARVELAPERMSTAELTAWKTLVDQLATLAENFVVNYLVLGNLTQTFGLLPWQITANSAQVSVHEWLWNSYGPSRLRETPTIDFTRVGVIRTAP
jgi:hypothetical protein